MRLVFQFCCKIMLSGSPLVHHTPCTGTAAQFLICGSCFLTNRDVCVYAQAKNVHRGQITAISLQRGLTSETSIFPFLISLAVYLNTITRDA